MGLLVVGTGALACLFATRLASSGNRVTMLGSWPEGLAALRQHGVRLVEMDGRVHQNPVGIIDSSDFHGNYTKALVLVKSWQTERAAKQLEKCLSVNGICLTLQNGWGNYETLAKALGKDRVALGVTTVGARMLEPGCVKHTGEGKVTIGNHPNLNGMDELLSKAGFQVELIADPQALLWGKLVINAAINPLTALLRVTNGELLSNPSTHELLREVASEAAMVADAIGVELPYTNLVDAVEEVARNTASNISSMLQDVLRGTPTEIEAINGAIVRAGERAGMPTPINRTLLQLVQGLGHQ